MTVPRLRAVLAHEFGHYGNLDTRLGGVTMRGREAVLHTVEMFNGGSTQLHRAIGALYVSYAHMFLRTSQSVARHQELAADRVAAQHAGRDATVATLRALPVLDAAHTHYMKTYAGLGEPLGVLPPVGEVYGGFRRLLAARPGERLAVLSAGQRSPRPHRYDSHPPTAERGALIEKLPADGRTDGAENEPAALTLLRDVDGVFAAIEARTLPHKAAPLRRMSWENLVMARAIVDAEGWSRPLLVAVARALRSSAQVADGAAPARQGVPSGQLEEAVLPGLEEVLDAFDRGLLWMEVADRMPKPPQAARLTGPSARNFIRPKIFDGLVGMVHLRLAGAGRATPEIAWSERPGLALPEEWEGAWTTPSTRPSPTRPTPRPCAPCSPASTRRTGWRTLPAVVGLLSRRRPEPGHENLDPSDRRRGHPRLVLPHQHRRPRRAAHHAGRRARHPQPVTRGGAGDGRRFKGPRHLLRASRRSPPSLARRRRATPGQRQGVPVRSGRCWWPAPSSAAGRPAWMPESRTSSRSRRQSCSVSCRRSRSGTAGACTPAACSKRRLGRVR